jgi:hypothetical protein
MMKGKNKRSHPRANTLLPFQVRRISLHESKGLDCGLSLGGIVIDDSSLPPVKDERLDRWLNMLNTKIDYLISLASPKREDVASMAMEPLNISGSGVSLIAKEPFHKGEIVEIRVVLQTYPAKILNLYGEVVRVESTPDNSGKYIIGIRFMDMSEEVRNEILKFDFKKHREKLLTGKRP